MGCFYRIIRCAVLGLGWPTCAAGGSAGFHVLLELGNLDPAQGFVETEETVKIKLMNANDYATGRSDLVEDQLKSRGYKTPRLQISEMSSLHIVNRLGVPVEPPPAGSVSDDDFPLDVQAVYVMSTVPDGADLTGTIIIDVFPALAPRGVLRVRELVAGKVWDLARFFRVVPGSVAQWGLPAEPAVAALWAEKTIEDDPVSGDGLRNTPFTVAFASAGPGTRSSQVFINFGNNGHLDGHFVPFGQVVKGFLAAERINDQHGEDPDQGLIRARGNAYLAEAFPGLSYIKTARIVEGPFPRDMAKTSQDLYMEEMTAAGVDVSAPQSGEL